MSNPRAAFVLLVLIIVAAASTANAQVVYMSGWRRSVFDLPQSDRPPHFALFPPARRYNNAVTRNPHYVAPKLGPGPIVIDNPFYKGPPIGDVSKPMRDGSQLMIVR